MYLYNISIIIEDQAHQQLLSWIKEEWLPTLGLDAKFLKMLYSPHEGFTYCVQIIKDQETQIQEFQSDKLSLLQQHIAIHFREKAFIFDSIMQYQ